MPTTAQRNSRNVFTFRPANSPTGVNMLLMTKYMRTATTTLVTP